MDFKRDAPTTATDISKVFSKALNYSIYPDCVTGLQLKYFSQSREICEQDEQSTFSILFNQVYIPELVFGDIGVSSIDRSEYTLDEQKHDVGLVYHCDNTWEVFAKLDPTRQPITSLVSDFNTCETLDGLYPATTPEEQGVK